MNYKATGQLNPAKGRSMRLDAKFALASMTKPMVAVAGLILMEQVACLCRQGIRITIRNSQA
ncbi:hypothetical protein [Bradyrhizobium sp. CCBAU 45384]|uniref:hypothetical protein n=1 Tax=Bradyrhizobium sp. CCBAU 45384 TaxID=858428 RepID=UPI003FA40CD4